MPVKLRRKLKEATEMREMKCMGCDTPIPPGGTKCPMCGAVNAYESPAAQQSQAAAPTISSAEVHHHHYPDRAEKPLLIEQTSKKWKKLYLWAWLFFFLGFMSCMPAVVDHSSSAGVMTGIFFLTGISLYIRARSGAWWNNS